MVNLVCGGDSAGMTIVFAAWMHPAFSPHGDREWLTGLLAAIFVLLLFGVGVWAILDARRRPYLSPPDDSWSLSGERLVRDDLLSESHAEPAPRAAADTERRGSRPLPVLIALLGLGTAASALLEARNLTVVAWFVGNADSALLEVLSLGFAVLLFMATALVLPAPRWAATHFAAAGIAGIAVAAAQWLPGRSVFERWEWVPIWIAAAFGLTLASWGLANGSVRDRVS